MTDKMATDYSPNSSESEEFSIAEDNGTILGAPLAYSIEDLMRLTGLGRTLIYDEVRDGRLIRTKCRRRSIYLPKHVASWLESLAREKARPRLDDPTDDESDPGI